MSTQAGPRPAVGVDELKRAWQAVQEGQFRGAETPPVTTGRVRAESSEQVWEPSEQVLPVIGCLGGAGATTVSLAIATVASTTTVGGGARVLECATVTATGLAAASTAELGHTAGGWARGTRDRVLLERAAGVMVGPQDLPPPAIPTQPVDLTVLDVSWELGHALSVPSWLGDQLLRAPTVVAVTTATIPGLRRLEGALALLESTRVVAGLVGPRRKRWPRQVASSMGSLTRGLDHLEQLVQIPHEQELALRGVDARALPSSLLRAAHHLLRLTQSETSQVETTEKGNQP